MTTSKRCPTCDCDGSVEGHAVGYYEQRIVELETALHATARWNLVDGLCWCELKREKAQNKIHSRGCKIARDVLLATKEVKHHA